MLRLLLRAGANPDGRTIRCAAPQPSHSTAAAASASAAAASDGAANTAGAMGSAQQQRVSFAAQSPLHQVRPTGRNEACRRSSLVSFRVSVCLRLLLSSPALRGCLTEPSTICLVGGAPGASVRPYTRVRVRAIFFPRTGRLLRTRGRRRGAPPRRGGPRFTGLGALPSLCVPSLHVFGASRGALLCAQGACGIAPLDDGCESDLHSPAGGVLSFFIRGPAVSLICPSPHPQDGWTALHTAASQGRAAAAAALLRGGADPWAVAVAVSVPDSDEESEEEARRTTTHVFLGPSLLMPCMRGVSRILP